MEPSALEPSALARSGLERSLRRYVGLLAGAVLVAFLSAFYVADLVSGPGRLPRGVVAAGVPIGGLEPVDAEQALRDALGTRSTVPVVLTAEAARAVIDPRAVGLAIDWAGTVRRANVRPVNPITRLTSLWVEREVQVVTTSDSARIGAALEGLDRQVTRPPVEGSVRFAGLEPVPVDPVGGRALDLAAALATIERDWLGGGPVVLPVVEVAAATTAADVRGAIDEVARPAVSAPVTVLGEGVRAVVAREVIASALTFRPDPAAGTGNAVAPGAGARLVPVIDTAAVTAAVRPGLAPSERLGRDATLDFAAGAPTVVESQDGRTIDYPATFATLPGVLTRTAGTREIAAVYTVRPAKVTADELRGLLTAGEVSTFTTGGFAADSGRNIRRAAEMINGKVVRPGQTFSLNGATNPRNAANGFVEAGIIEQGRPARGVGGGVSQVATTLYNAAYFAGMTDVEHQEHSFYISRYPVAREATVFDDVIDVKFRNEGPAPVLILTRWTPSSLTVRMLGTKIFEVTSATGPRSNPTSPPVIEVGGRCTPSKGAAGFTASDTRTLRELRTGQTRRETRTVTYRPSPTIVCAG